MVIRYTGAMIKLNSPATTKRLILLGHTAIVFNQEIIEALVTGNEHRETTVSQQGQNEKISTGLKIGHWLLTTSNGLPRGPILVRSVGKTTPI